MRASRSWPALLLLVALSRGGGAPARAWFPPGEDPEGSPGVHGEILLRGIEILRRDGYVAAATLFERYRRPLLQGNRDADKGGGYLEEAALLEALDRKVLAKRPHAVWAKLWVDRRPKVAAAIDAAVPFGIPVSPFTHFYNPRTDRGLRMTLGRRGRFDLDAVLPLLERFSALPWEWATLLGPHMASTDRVEWDHARAVDAFRAAVGLGDPARGEEPAVTGVDIEDEARPVSRELVPALAVAMRHLGRAVHIVADSTVPHHADDDGSQNVASRHLKFEAFAETVIRKTDFRHAEGGLLQVAGGPAEFVRAGAAEALRWIPGGSGDEAAMEAAVRALVPLAERLTAGMLLRFLQTWSREDRAVVGVKVIEVERVRGHDWTSKEDFQARLEIAGHGFETGVLHGADRVRPQVYLPDAWFHVRPVRWSLEEARGSEVPVTLALLDDDNGRKTMLGLRSGPVRPLSLVVDVATGEVRGEGVSGVVGDPIEVRGDWRRGPAARAVFLVERYPRPRRALMSTASGSGGPRGLPEFTGLIERRRAR